MVQCGEKDRKHYNSGKLANSWAGDEIAHLVGHGLGSRSHNFIFTSSKCSLINLNVPHLNVPPGAAKFS